MTIERKHVGPRLSQVVIHGDTVYLAGIVAAEPVSDDPAEQTRQILAADRRAPRRGRHRQDEDSCRRPSGSPTSRTTTR